MRTLNDVVPTLLIWAGLLWSAAVAGWLVYARRARPIGSLPAFLAPIGAIGLGFLLGHWHAALWVIVVSTVVGGLCELARRWFVAGPYPADEVPPVAAALAVVTAAGTLLQFGAMLAVRLVIRPDPEDSLLSGLRSAALLSGVRALGVPLFGVLVLVAAAVLLRRRIGRLARWLAQDSTHGMATWPYRRRPGRLALLAWLSLLVLFALPAIVPGDHLTVLGVATPEYGKLLLLLALAVVVAFDSYQVATVSRLGVLQGLGRRWVAWPLGLFLAVMLGSAARHDFGTAVSTLAAMVGVTWSAVRFGMDRLPDRHGRGRRADDRVLLRRSLQTFRPFSAIGLTMLVLVGVVGFFATDYVRERGRVWLDPWQYRWDSGCVMVDPTPSVTPFAVSVAAREEGATAVPSPAAIPSGPAAPAGWARCQQAEGADDESERSQLARALSAVADGGLWGRGLRDTGSSVVPAGSTDFVLVVVWDKLGAVAVLGAAALTVVLGVALPRAVRLPHERRYQDRGPTAAELFAAGIGTMIVGQFVFVMAATVNVIPHSGVPAPLLSRGGQSNLVLLAGIALALGLGAGARRAVAEPEAALWGNPGARGPIGAPGPYAGRAAGRLGAALTMGLAVAIVAGITAEPYWALAPAGGGPPRTYSELRAACPPRPPDRDGQRGRPPRPTECSTDRLAYRRTVIEIRFGPRRALRQERPDEVWKVVDDPALGGLTGADLAGLLRVGRGPIGTLDRAYTSTLYGSTGTALTDRLLPHHAAADDDPADGGLALTLDPALQHALGEALRAGDPGGPLPAGAVVIDVDTADVLAGVSAPPQPRAAKRDPDADRATIAEFRKGAPEYGPVAADGSLGGTKADPDCARRSADDPCWRWSIQPDPQRLDPAAEAELRRYVGGDPGVRLPDAGVDRAFGHGYPLGAEVLPIVAGAYLAGGGHALTDKVETPPGLTVGDAPPVSNPPGCQADADGTMTLARALAGACGTAFLRLIQREHMGWPQLVDQARRFGFTIGNCREAPAWLADALATSAGTCVPGDSDDVAETIAAALTGGGGVVGTPLGVATMFASVGNAGARRQPTLVSAATAPDTGLTLAAPPAQPGTAMSPGAAAALAAALTGPGAPGGAVALGAAVEIRTPPAGEFAERDVWLAGFVKTPRYGTVAFAVVVECRDAEAGARRARSVLDALEKIGG